MKLDGRRTSSNVEDLRGGSSSGSGMRMSTGKKSGCLSIILLIIGAIWYFKTGDASMLSSSLGGSDNMVVEQTSTKTGNSAKSDELATFASRILASTEDIWTKIFQDNGISYKQPKMVIFSDAVNTGCGSATSSTGPFYCSADEKLYLDLTFFQTMKSQLGADGDLAYAYVIAHEVGHHVEYLTGVLS
ncbi:MAG: neutral zinc metallopeptidase, partial [Bacteroidales bacterium]|nr:neutral zinc metallopeptidase [Bacteroidales bacterium]